MAYVSPASVTSADTKCGTCMVRPFSPNRYWRCRLPHAGLVLLPDDCQHLFHARFPASANIRGQRLGFAQPYILSSPGFRWGFHAATFDHMPGPRIGVESIGRPFELSVAVPNPTYKFGCGVGPVRRGFIKRQVAALFGHLTTDRR
jgi:hypothetical protein